MGSLDHWLTEMADLQRMVMVQRIVDRWHLSVKDAEDHLLNRGWTSLGHGYWKLFS